MARVKQFILGDPLSLDQPLEQAGRIVEKQAAILQRNKQKASKDIGEALSSMKGRDVDYSAPLESFRQKLEDSNIKVNQNIGDDGIEWHLDTDRSMFSGDGATNKFLSVISKRLSDLANENQSFSNVKAEDLHDLKKLIDYRVNWGKLKEDSLSSQAEGLVMSLRADINKSLQDASPEYKKANQDYSNAIRPLAQLNEVTNSRINVLDDNLSPTKLGQEMRKMTGNWVSTPDMIKAVNDLSVSAKKAGYDKSINLAKLVVFDTHLRNYFGVSENKGNSMAGITEQAVRGDKLGAARDAGSEAVKKSRKVNSKEAMKDLIKFFDSQGTNK